MTLNATQARNFTDDSITRNLSTDVNGEIQQAENRIRQAAAFGKFKVAYNAQVIGNPPGSPQTSNLTTAQQQFLDHFETKGYVVGVDDNSGFWLLDWAEAGSEITVSIYSVRTTATPGGIASQTISAIDSFFSNRSPVVTSKTTLVDPLSSGGDIPESDFGAPDSTFYEYLVIADQQNDTNHAADLKVALKASGLGYTDETRIVGSGTAGNTTSPSNSLNISNGSTIVLITVGGTGTATDFVNSVNANTTLQSINISADINGSDVVLRNNVGGTLTATNNVGNVLGDLFALASPQTGALVDNTEVYKIV